MKKYALTLCLIIFGFNTNIFASVTDTISIESKFLKKENKSVVIVPDSYNESKLSYPVLYLLHGYSGKYDNWIKLVPEIKSYSDKYQVIVVCPDGGYAGWYIDSPIVEDNQYESFFTKELIPYVDQNYRSIREKRARAITGLSMGGHGALYMALNNLDLFGVAGSMSGVLDINSIERYEINQLTGPKGSDTRKQFSVFYNIPEKLAGLSIIIDCGRKDVHLESNVRVHEKLLEMNIAHDFTIREGGHTWKYWANSVEYHFLFFYKSL